MRVNRQERGALAGTAVAAGGLPDARGYLTAVHEQAMEAVSTRILVLGRLLLHLLTPSPFLWLPVSVFCRPARTPQQTQAPMQLRSSWLGQWHPT